MTTTIESSARMALSPVHSLCRRPFPPREQRPNTQRCVAGDVAEATRKPRRVALRLVATEAAHWQQDDRHQSREADIGEKRKRWLAGVKARKKLVAATERGCSIEFEPRSSVRRTFNSCLEFCHDAFR